MGAEIRNPVVRTAAMALLHKEAELASERGDAETSEKLRVLAESMYDPLDDLMLTADSYQDVREGASKLGYATKLIASLPDGTLDVAFAPIEAVRTAKLSMREHMALKRKFKRYRRKGAKPRWFCCTRPQRAVIYNGKKVWQSTCYAKKGAKTIPMNRTVGTGPDRPLSVQMGGRKMRQC